MIDKKESIDQLLHQIEVQLNWGGVAGWSNSDFENLSELIYQETTQRLSVTTLKRSWGRTSQSVTPSITTLNILSQFIGADSWRGFLNGLAQTGSGEIKVHKPVIVHSASLFRSGGFILGLLAIVMVIAMIFAYDPAQISEKSAALFEIEKVTSGIPNTVLFKYDVSGISADSFELQQSWDKRKRQLIDPNDTLVTSTYFYPGYFNAKLVADCEIIKNRNLYLSSDGFDVFAFIEGKNAPLHVSQNYWSIVDNRFFFEEDMIDYHKYKAINTFLMVNLMEEPVISSESFNFKMSFRLAPEDEGDPCNPISLIITGTEEVYMFSFGNPGCSGKFSAYLSEEYIGGENNDLSYMGVKEQELINLEINKLGGAITFSIGENSHTLSKSCTEIGLLGGVRIFTGQEVEIDLIEISDNDRNINLLEPFAPAEYISSSIE